MIDPVIKEISVAASPKAAFEVFTSQIANWWPLATHSLSASAGKIPKSLTLTPKVGGTIQEEMHDGTIANWGVITEWRPGRKLAFTWHLRRPESEQTHVSIEFLANGEGTVVKLIHSDWEAMGEDAGTGRDQYHTGWDTVLAQFINKLAA